MGFGSYEMKLYTTPLMTLRILYMLWGKYLLSGIHDFVIGLACSNLHGQDR